MKLFLLFIIYAILGYIVEVSGKLIIEKKLVNRGFLIGPWLPIYGFGGLFITVLLGQLKTHLILLFLSSVILCSILEYLTSYILEKIFHVRWWDYSRYKYNLNGRICLVNLFIFGILGLVMIYLLNPIIFKLLDMLSITSLKIIFWSVLCVFINDFIVSCKVITKLTKSIKLIKKDSTEDLTKQIRKLFTENARLYLRVLESFPNLIKRKKILNEIKDKLRGIVKRGEKK